MKCFFVTVVNCNRAEWYTELWFRCVPEQHGSFFYVHVRVVTRQQSFDSCPVFCRFAQISRCEFDLHWDRVSTKGEDSSQRWRVTSGKFYWVVCNPKKKQWIRFTPLPKRLEKLENFGILNGSMETQNFSLSVEKYCTWRELFFDRQVAI